MMVTEMYVTRYVAAYLTLKQTAPVVVKVLWENF